MAIDRICVTGNLADESKWYFGYRIYAGQTAPSNLYVTWHTAQYKPDGTNMCHSSFIFKTRWTGIKKGEAPRYAEYPSTFSTPDPISASSCFLKQDGDGAIWKCDLTAILAASPAYRGNSWAFDQREYDEIKIELTIYAAYNTSVYNWDNGYSPISTTELYIGYFPDYQITRVARKDTSDVIIEYTAAGWERTDDRYELLAFKSNGVDLINPHWATGSWSVGSLGHITIPAQQFTRLPQVGESVYVSLRWNAAYKSPGLDFASDSGTFTVGGSSDAEDIEFDFDVYDGSLDVLVQDTAYSEINVQLEGERWSFDIINAQVSDAEAQALLAFPPLGVDFTVSVTGYKTVTEGQSTYDAYSETVSQTFRIDPENCYWIDVIDANTGLSDGTPTIKALFKNDWNVTHKPEKSFYKLSGRRCESAMRGYGYRKSVTFSFDIAPFQVNTECGLEAIFQLQEADTVVIRSPKGERYVVEIEQVRHSTANRDDYMHVSILGREVPL